MEPGFRFAPDDHVLTDVYLAGEIAGRPVASRYIHRGADLYSALPEALVSGHERVRDSDGNDACFLYTRVRYNGKKKKRGVDGDPRKSYWHSEKGKIPLEGSNIGGYVQDFTHVVKDAGGRKDRTGWRMKEYGLSTKQHGDSHIVLCKVYHTRRNPSKASTSTTTSATTAEDLPAYSDPAVISSKKRKAVHGDYPEDSTPSARPRLTGEHPPTTTTDPEPGVDELYNMYCHGIDETEWNIATAPPSSFFQSVEQEFPSLYPSFHNNVPVTDEAATPWAPADQPEEDCYYYVMEQESPSLYPVASTDEASPPRAPAPQPEENASIAADHQDAILGEADEVHPEPQPDDEAIYGLPCPAFSPEMIRRCSDEPWPSPSSMAMIFGI